MSVQIVVLAILDFILVDISCLFLHRLHSYKLGVDFYRDRCGSSKKTGQ